MKTISDEYLRLNQRLHEDNTDFGISGDQSMPLVMHFINQWKPAEILDYGCGKGRLARALKTAVPDIPVREYDPAIPGKTMMPDKAGMVICGDVLEHVEPEYLTNVLLHIHSLTKIGAILIVHTRAAEKVLADGRNAHLTQQPPEWWLALLQSIFRKVSGVGKGKDADGTISACAFAVEP